MSDQDSFAARLLGALRRSNVTQAALARAADIDQSSISRYLRGQCEPNLRQFRAIAQALGVRPTDLLPTDGEGDTLIAVENAGGHHLFRGKSYLGHWTGALEFVGEPKVVEGKAAQKLLTAAKAPPRKRAASRES